MAITMAGMIISDVLYIIINWEEKAVMLILIPTTTDRNTEVRGIAVRRVSMKRLKAKEVGLQKNMSVYLIIQGLHLQASPDRKLLK
ncbi:hypothetical protein FACS18947_4830 [Bacteroidia bacterium]|nr:hypothetical protein FACS18947_4830 [Bacteroidia bacterium]